MSPKSDGVGLQARDSGSYTSSKAVHWQNFLLLGGGPPLCCSSLQLIE